jgi:hypothetical protein
MATPAPKAGGNILTRKLGPLPGWAWVGIAFGGYYLWKKRQAAAAAASTAPSTSTAASLPGYVSSGGSGYGYQGPGVGYGGSGAIPTGATAATSSSYTPATGQTQSGSGYDVGGAQGSTNNSVTSSGGGVYNQIGGSQLSALQAAGQTVYYQSQPGIFTPYNSQDAAAVAPGTGLFQQVAGNPGQ